MFDDKKCKSTTTVVWEDGLWDLVCVIYIDTRICVNHIMIDNRINM